MEYSAGGEERGRHSSPSRARRREATSVGRGGGSKDTSGNFRSSPSSKGVAVTVAEGGCKKPDYGKFRIPSSKELNRECNLHILLKTMCVFNIVLFSSTSS